MNFRKALANVLCITGMSTVCIFTACSKQEAQLDSEKTATPATEPAKIEAPAKTEEPANTKKIDLADNSSITWIQDNIGEKLNPRDLFSDASDSLYNSLDQPNGIPASVSTFLLHTDGEYILFDAGLGSFGGQLLNHLNELGVSPDSIKKIYLTHLHVDHINGLLNGEEKAFKNATVYLGRVEHDAWMNDIEKNDLQKKIIGTYSDKLQLFAFGDTLPHQVLTMDAVGHTPGHTVFQKGEVLVIGDLMHGYALQKDHPEINSNYDMDKEKSIEARKRILEYAKQNNLTMAGMHLPPPGFAK